MNRRLVGRLARAALIAATVALAISDLLGRSSKWVILDNCSLIRNAANDGDSFHVRVKRREYIFRLYFVDAPETDASLAGRLDEQAKYFGITVDQTLQIGELAKRFTAEKLSRPFTVRTCKEDALGRSKNERFYAFVQTSDGDLAEKLVENGLARVHGTSGKPTGLLTTDAEWAKLEQLQTNARAEKIGGWGLNFGRMAVRSHKEGGTPYDGFDDFFRAKGAAASTPDAWNSTPSKMRQPPVAPAKLDVNNATEEQLQQIPGIGPALAGQIIAGRPFRSADDLKIVKGIGTAKYAKIRPYFK